MIRSAIFVPGNQARMIEKAHDFEADAVMLDLEDGVPAGEKDRARELIAACKPAEFRGQLMVRINGLDADCLQADVRAAVSAGAAAVLLPKAERPADVRMVSELLPADMQVIPAVESARAVLRAPKIAKADRRVAALNFGPEDFARDLAVERTRDGAERMQALGLVVLAARAAGLPVIDGPFGDFRDAEGLEADCQRARRIGVKGKFAIHPAQLQVINRVFGPSPEELDWARRAAAAFEAAAAEGRGAVSLDGQMVDEPVYRRAKDLLA